MFSEAQMKADVGEAQLKADFGAVEGGSWF